MARFRYKAATAAGEVLEGQMDAPTRDVVVRRLQAQGHVPIRAEEVEREHAPAHRSRLRRMSRRDVDVFTLELTTLLSAGMPLDGALELLVGIARPGPFRDIVARVHADVRGGADLSTAMERHPAAFSRFYRNMVRAGEASGALDQALERLAEHRDHAARLRETLISALIYPALLVGFACVSLAAILGLVIPRISEMFDTAGEKLPAITRLVVATGDLVHGYWWLGAAVLAALYAWARAALRDPAKLERWHAQVLRMPVVGTLVAKHEAARFSRTLGTLLGNGVPLLDGIAIAGQAIVNRRVALAVERVGASVREGRGLARPLVESGVFPELAGHLLRVGEQTGNLEAMLLRIARIYDREVETSVRRLVDILSPVLILVLGALIAGIIMSVLAAVLSINQLAI